MQDLSLPTLRKGEFRYVFKAAIVDEDKRIQEGYCTVEIPDRDEEIINVDSVLDCFVKFMQNPLLMYIHDLHKPIGRVLEYKETTKGNVKAIWIRTKHAKSDDPRDYIEKSWNLAKQGLLAAYSIRGRPSHVKTVKVKGNQYDMVYIKDLIEISLVPIPANQESLGHIVAKSLADPTETHPDDGELQVNEEDLKKMFGDLTSQLTESIKTTVSEQLAPVEAKLKALEEKVTVEEEAPPAETPPISREDLQKMMAEELAKLKTDDTLKKALADAPPGNTEATETGNSEETEEKPSSTEDTIKTLQDERGRIMDGASFGGTTVDAAKFNDLLAKNFS